MASNDAPAVGTARRALGRFNVATAHLAVGTPLLGTTIPLTFRLFRLKRPSAV
jgi:hypothetical protein